MKLFDFRDQVVVVTGASRGIGFTLARSFSTLGAKVVVLGRNASTIQQAANDIQSETANETLGLVCDVTDEQQIERMTEEVIKRFGKIDVLVNNAGATVRKTLDHLEQEEWEKIMKTNVTSVFLTTKVVARKMKEARYGRIINIASMSSEITLSFSTAYGPSKAAVVHFTKQTASELAPYNITVNAVSPGFVKTSLNAKALEDDEFRRPIENRNSMRRIGTIDEIITPVVFFAAKGSSYVTGQNLLVDGGTTSFGF
ncbi:SDR family NAD(P)-dependent oxidoreductase [Priestia koreensis]|uniref:SDR family NAD(P)-dependent oxidoreductase n=1 Tax=Priestia koreensis TaxID=284581 RepID=UPI001F5A8AA6|nr:glucose 1-dehydrogenase [Priestia koreensis]MCM3002713.1 SDR family oxidoreductase [Priestia koreensis]UNL84411.1 SDR family oxidoreductase [Priestia koreensis]